MFYWHTWFVWVLERFYGAIDGHWLRALRHASYDKPAFITQSSLAAMLIAAILAFVAAYVITLGGSLRGRKPSPDPTAPAPGPGRRPTGAPAASNAG